MVDTVLSYCHYFLNDQTLADMFSYFQQQGIGIISAENSSTNLLCIVTDCSRVHRVPAGTVHAVLYYCHYSSNDKTLADIVSHLQQQDTGIISAGSACLSLLCVVTDGSHLCTGCLLGQWIINASVLSMGLLTDQASSFSLCLLVHSKMTTVSVSGPSFSTVVQVLLMLILIRTCAVNVWQIKV